MISRRDNTHIAQVLEDLAAAEPELFQRLVESRKITSYPPGGLHWFVPGEDPNFKPRVVAPAVPAVKASTYVQELNARTAELLALAAAKKKKAAELATAEESLLRAEKHRNRLTIEVCQDRVHKLKCELAALETK